MKVHELLAVAAICSSAGRPAINDNYAQRRDRLADERSKALAKKQAVREQIRARRAALKAAL